MDGHLLSGAPQAPGLACVLCTASNGPRSPAPARKDASPQGDSRKEVLWPPEPETPVPSTWLDEAARVWQSPSGFLKCFKTVRTPGARKSGPCLFNGSKCPGPKPPAPHNSTVRSRFLLGGSRAQGSPALLLCPTWKRPGPALSSSRCGSLQRLPERPTGPSARSTLGTPHLDPLCRDGGQRSSRCDFLSERPGAGAQHIR